MDPPSDPSADPGWRHALRGAFWVLVPGHAIRPGGSTTTVSLVVAAFGVAVVAAPRLVERDLDCSDDRSLTRSYTNRFFLRLAFGEPPALAGFVGFVLCGNPLVYGLGLVFAAVGSRRAAPTSRSLAEDQERLRVAGCGRSLMVTLRTPAALN